VSRYGSSPERSLDPPEPKTPPSGDKVIYVERPIPNVETEEGEGIADWIELAVDVNFDEGRVFSAYLEGTDDEIALTPGEIENAEVDWSEDCAAFPDERDDSDRDLDR
jgi:hypothetical protein